MLELGLLISTALALAGWAYHRRASAFAIPRPRSAAAPRAAAPLVAAPRPPPPLDPARIDSVNKLSAERLWRLAYHIRSPSRELPRVDRLVRENVVAILQVDDLNHAFFPRRPTLMPQLMQALDDPQAASDKLSRIIAHDPVLAADVLRMANSSLYRSSAAPIESIQRAITVCGADALRAILAKAMLRPVFRATSRNFPRLPRLLWGRTELAARAAELYATQHLPADRFESPLVILLNALGPLVVYSAVLDVYARNPHFAPNTALCVALTDELAPAIAQRIARDWQISARLVAALEKSADEALTGALLTGELLGTVCFLESQTVISRDERIALLDAAGMPDSVSGAILAGLKRR
ncbi:MAG: HDOD domain-containing protein [Gammaproteobacteria bacterium]|nr:HDOD domain-containing protein [Gammaproteobacteria bacterium]